MSNFITAAETNRRLSDEHKAAREAAVEEINKLIRAAKWFPIVIPKSLLGDIEVVRCELIRKLRDESGWDIQTDDDSLKLWPQGYRR